MPAFVPPVSPVPSAACTVISMQSAAVKNTGFNHATSGAYKGPRARHLRGKRHQMQRGLGRTEVRRIAIPLPLDHGRPGCRCRWNRHGPVFVASVAAVEAGAERGELRIGGLTDRAVRDRDLAVPTMSRSDAPVQGQLLACPHCRGSVTRGGLLPARPRVVACAQGSLRGCTGQPQAKMAGTSTKVSTFVATGLLCTRTGRRIGEEPMPRRGSRGG